MTFPDISIALPDWVGPFLADRGDVYATLEQRAVLAVDLSAENVRRGTGGPFGAAVFACGTGRLIAPGVNVVVPSHCPAAHAEVVALAIAARVVGRHDLADCDAAPLELVTSCEPCTMCLGATFWSGVARLVCCARQEDAEAAGFDEGPKPVDWVGELAGRGIETLRDVNRNAAVAVLRDYAQSGKEIY